MKPARAIRPEFYRRGFALVAILIVAALLIGVGGTAAYIKLSQKPTPSPSPLVNQPSPDSSSPALAKNETVYTEESRSANWKTYTNPKYSFKKPSNLTMEEDTDGNVSGRLNSNKISISTEPTNLDLRNYIDKKTWCTSISSTTGKPFTLGSENSLRFDKTPCGITGTTDIYAIHNGTAIHISVETQQNYDSIEPIFNQILSTFRFLN